MYPRLAFRMQFRIGPQLVLAGKVLRASAGEVEEMVLQEVQANPALELAHEAVEISSFDSQRSTRTRRNKPWDVEDWDSLDERLVARTTAVEQLVAQAALLVEREDLEIAVELLYSLDDHGYLRTPLAELAAWLDARQEHLERVLAALQELEPPGIGARDLRECLSIQCAHLSARGMDCDLPRRILDEAWEDFTSQRWSRVSRKTGAARAEVEAAVDFIHRNLYPYPLRLLPDCSGDDQPLGFPDLVIHRLGSADRPVYRLEIPGEELFELRLSSVFQRPGRAFLRHSSETGCGKSSLRSAEPAMSPHEREWVEAQAGRARAFMAALEQRWGTLRRIGEFLITFQAGFLEHGPQALQPLTRAAVAAALDLHESTISRAVSDKTIQLPDGRLRPLSDLFDAALPVRERIRQLLSEKGGRLSDREIAARLQAEGCPVARRTVAKYRAQLNLMI